MSDKLFIAIGVKKAKGLAELPGVWSSVGKMVAWAGPAGYCTVRITDEDGDVDVARVKTEIMKKLVPGLKRIIFYFVGHGYSVPPEQYLILSAGPSVPDQRIARDGLRDMLATYAPEQVSVVTDACMVLAPLRGLAASVIDPQPGLVPRQTFDAFYATQPDTSAFAFRATDAEPELCLFSWVLHRALTFEAPEAIDTYFTTPERRVVTSDSLGDYLDSALPDEAAARKVWQQPQTNTGFRPPNHVYSEALTPGADDGTDGRPSQGMVEDDGQVTSPRAAIDEAPARPPPARENAVPLEKRVRSEWRRPFMGWAYEAADKTGASLILDVLRGGLPVVRSAEFQPAPLTPIYPFGGQDHRDAFAVAPVTWPDDRKVRSANALLSIGQRHSLIPLHRDLWCAVQVEKGRGPIAMAWGRSGVPPSQAEISALEVLKGLFLGRLSASDIPGIAASMREDKHSDPMKGIISAYLYDAIGDVQNIRRMCFYYKAKQQDVPFDIALLSKLTLQAEGARLYIDVPKIGEGKDKQGPEYTYRETPAVCVGVAGHAPLLRAGWTKLHWAGRRREALLPLADHLTDNPIATFMGKAARYALIELIAP